MSEDDREQFEIAFSVHRTSQIGECECGRIFWDGYNTGYDWHEGQEAELEANPKATRVQWGVEYVEIMGIEYCQDCDCWLSKAERVVNWLRDNQKSIGEWFKLERKRIQRQLESVPQIGDLK